jgi:LacI family transcriptional regulator
VLGGKADESISIKARDRVLKAARELGYTPNSAAQALRSGRSGLIGFWMCMEYSRYRSMVLSEMRRILADSEFALAVTDVDEDYTWHHSFARALRVPVEGIIAFDASTGAKAFAEDSDRLAPNLPFVSMGAFWADTKSYVGVDLRAGAEDAVAHLFDMGRRKIAYMVPQETYFVANGERFEGYRDKILELGLNPQTIEICDDPSKRISSITQALKACRDAGQMPDALFCLYDDIAVDAVFALEELGLKAGIDVALIGVNGTEGIERGSCPITSVRQPIEEMCSLAFKMLKAQIEDSRAPVEQVMLRPELIVRESSNHRV